MMILKGIFKAGRRGAGKGGLGPQEDVGVGGEGYRWADRQTDGKVPREWRGEGGLGSREGTRAQTAHPLSATFPALLESGKTHPVCLGVGKWLF